MHDLFAINNHLERFRWTFIGFIRVCLMDHCWLQVLIILIVPLNISSRLCLIWEHRKYSAYFDIYGYIYLIHACLKGTVLNKRKFINIVLTWIGVQLVLHSWSYAFLELIHCSNEALYARHEINLIEAVIFEWSCTQWKT